MTRIREEEDCINHLAAAAHILNLVTVSI